ncbi:HEXXH motif domain-containing protein [Streptomyces sp. NPDC051985]|uniref:HEXXH motif domain-containing protein n=1 Tax=Streptomyces sp. NPDC051985 TaxID=3155807 RepID=UPI0034328FBA
MTEPMALRMTAEDFGALARCRPAPSALAVLRRAQSSRRLLLLTGLADAARRLAPESWTASAAAGWDLCVQAFEANVQAFEEVLLHPHVGVWLARCLRAVHGTGGDEDLAVDLARLGTFGHAAALRGGLRPRVALPVPDGLLWLPTLGVVRLPEGTGTVRLDGWTLELPGREINLHDNRLGQSEQRDNGHRDGAVCRFTPHRLVIPSAASAPCLSVVVEDIDPYRDVHGFPVQSRQTPAQLMAWHAALDEAWRLLNDLMPERAADCAGLWSALVPLRPGPLGRGRSSSTREAYGAVAVAPERDPVRLAETVLHETSHIGLAALTDLVDLADPEDQTRHRVGWRPDPRPLGAVLTGTHAHLGLLEFWSRVYHELGGAPARAAEARLYRYGRQVAAALRVLQRNRTALTSWGTYFVGCMTDEAELLGFRVGRPMGIHPSVGSGVKRPTLFRATPGEPEDIPPSGAAEVRPPPPHRLAAL